jgi:hypothetical protein
MVVHVLPVSGGASFRSEANVRRVKYEQTYGYDFHLLSGKGSSDHISPGSLCVRYADLVSVA